MPIKKILSKEEILLKTRRSFAINGSEGTSMRTLAKEVGISPSVFYHYYPDRESLLTEMFRYTTKQLGVDRKKLQDTNDKKELLRSRVNFQIEHMEEITAIMKYFLHFKNEFKRNQFGFVPKTACIHMLEVLDDPTSMESIKKAKVMTHAVNGFVLEYFPNLPTGEEKEELVNYITEFLYTGAFEVLKIDKKVKGGELINK